MRSITQFVGFLAFVAGLLLAIVAGIVAPDSGAMILTLVILGIIVGILNITIRDTQPLLIAAVALIVVGTTGFSPLDDLVSGLGTHVDQVVFYLARLMAPAAIIAATRTLITVGFPKY